MKRALIIGATGGIGSAVSAELETRGFAVTGLSRRDGLDVTDAGSVARVLGALDGVFDIVFIAIGTLAAGGVPEKSLAAVEAQRMADVFAINAIGPALILAQLERLLPADRPSVVGVLSARVGSIGDNKIGGWHSYRASKAALNQIVHGAAIEVGRKRKEAAVVALHPGTVETAFTAGYPGHSKVSAQQAAANLCHVMMGLDASQTGNFFDYSGAVVAW
ncbi:SDR family NAD(P)-dependent oxidoreductase [Octadecabacter sp. G9-8]|uniref:SDR family NAD(P)-dependent oxidoreductase n=1 Tax=Octadecabacter dasysiphoniae TaxID=2909341 RepID=A0ABS9CUH9_9RHOB|nr:SDR family NAD(P)-dependent oxidoreductase [Octadecabacter dasysiphoniae]MCF2870904.1 SDR family NAD(P)-dependent oxidoreductase [Octadecabacter dasysiphoniae]